MPWEPVQVSQKVYSFPIRLVSEHILHLNSVFSYYFYYNNYYNFKLYYNLD